MLIDAINVTELFHAKSKISLFGKMQSGRSPSFELFQLDLYMMYARCVCETHMPLVATKSKSDKIFMSYNLTQPTLRRM